jgi:uncharacterized membrane protein YdbT with pleckstrin-like domain
VPFSRKLLHEDENVLLETRQHWWLLVAPTTFALFVLAAIVSVFVLWSSAPAWFGWFLLAVGLVDAAYFLSRLFRWRSTDLVVTSMRVIYRRGALRRVVREIPISSVQNVEYSQSILGRLVGRGHLTVESAASSGSEQFADIPHPAEVQGIINGAIEQSRQHSQPAAVASNEGGSVADEIERLGDLHKRGIITDSEFARLKSDLIEDHQTGDEDR